MSLLITLGTPHHGTQVANGQGWKVDLLSDLGVVIAGRFVDDMRWDGYNASFFCNPSLRALSSFSDNGQFLFFPGLVCPTPAERLTSADQ